MPKNFSMITINGIEYMPTPHEVDPSQPEDMVWTQIPPHNLFLSDPTWYDGLGQSPIVQRRIWSLPEETQIQEFATLLAEHPARGLDMLFDAALKGKPHVVRFLLGQGVKPTAKEAGNPDESLAPLHAAAYQGRIECVRILVEEAGVDVNVVGEFGGTPLMRACWGGHPEIVQYLLDAGADMTLRQTVADHSKGTSHDAETAIDDQDRDQGTNAFEFAAGSGSVECVKKLIHHAEAKGINITELANRKSLAATAQSGNLKMLELILKLKNYPQQDPNGTWTSSITLLTTRQKAALEYALQITLTRNEKAVPPLLSYIEARDPASSKPIFPSLSQETFDKLVVFTYGMACNEVAFDLELLTRILNLFFTWTFTFTSSSIQDRNILINDAFVVAARHNNIEMLRFLTSLPSTHPEWNITIDPNHISQDTNPLWTSALYSAAGDGQVDAVKFLFDTYGTSLNVHLGNGKFANGPTALFRAVWDGQLEAVRLLLERGGGPVTDIDAGLQVSLGQETEASHEATNGKDTRDGEDTQWVLVEDNTATSPISPTPIQTPTRLVVVAAMAPPYPVMVMDEDGWTRRTGETLPKEQGELPRHEQSQDQNGDSLVRVVLDLEESHMEWLRKLRLRKGDGELLAGEKTGSKRVLKEV
ncbi:E3 ubiquitin-protein ligase mib1 [Knufia fluminis]|uniref:E3 ubiquitin-protein ligase mib1 n=1 Tax=Knufia fluminis TaxID=191047 RepID=A0AAN8EGF8_9EURO|nr:E3 ubiquitin-protein ligase mib1 [Knufia fluminis]